MRISLATLALTAAIATSCQTADKTTDTAQTKITLDTSVKFDPASVNKTAAQDQQQPVIQPQFNTASLPLPSNGIPVSTAASTTPARTTSGNVALNPAHGQPGHRCDLEVGAPLTAPAPKVAATPAAATTPAASTVPSGTQINITPDQLAAAAQKSAGSSSKKLNPEHGKPGHRCDIAVGAPLDSPAPKTGTTPAANPVSITPIAPDNAAPANGATPKLNPAHGQPGHDCTIEVGQPLKK